MIGTCDMPRGNAPQASLRAVRSRDEHRAQRLLAELSAQSDTAAPVSVPAPEREVSPALLGSLPRRIGPDAIGAIVFAAPTPLRSVTSSRLLRPPRA
jgi:hypothetical protein